MSVNKTDVVLTVQEAIDILNVSKSYFAILLETNKIPYNIVGNRRKVLFNDLVEFKKNVNAARTETLGKLVEESQKLGMYE